MVLSEEAERIHLLSGEKEADWMDPVCTLKVLTSNPVLESQT
jgi:hypothetical protein